MSTPRADLLLEHAGFIRALARSLLHDEHAADDVLQETLVAALETDERPRNLRAWLGVVARNLALTARRGRQRRTGREQRAASREALPSVDEGVARLELQRRVVDEVLALDEPYRSVIVHRFFYGLNLKEIGRRLDVPLETVRTRQRRALAQLRGRLDDSYGDRRSWSVVLLPLVTPRWATLIGGTLIMTGQLKIAAALLLVALLAWLTADLVSTSSPPPRQPVSARTVTGFVPASPVDSDGGSEARADDFAAVDRDLDLHGIVVGESGAPIAGAQVQSVRFLGNRGDLPGRSAWSRDPGPATETDAQGRFVLQLERGDQVALQVSASDHASVLRRWCEAGGRVKIVLRRPSPLTVRTFDEQGRVLPHVQLVLSVSPTDAVVPGDAGRFGVFGETGADGTHVFPATGSALVAWHPAFALAWVSTPAKSEVDLTLERGRTVSGTVLDAETHRPVAAATIVEFPPHIRFKQVRTNAAGEFAYAGWGLEASKGNRLYCTAVGYALALRSVEQGRPTDFRLKRGEDASGRVLDAEGEPVAGAYVTAVGISGEELERLLDLREGRTDADGGFRLADLRTDLPHTLVVLKRGYGRYLLDFDPGRAMLGDIVLPQGRRVEGQLLNAGGRPIPDAIVTLSGANSDRDRLRPDAPRTAGIVDGVTITYPAAAQLEHGNTESRRTDDLGRFRFRDLAPGIYTIDAVMEGGASRTRRVTVKDDVVGLVFKMEGTEPFVVHVVDGAGRPLPETDVQLNKKGGARRGKTDATGRVTFRLPPKTEQVQVAAMAGGPRRVGSGRFISHRPADGEMRIVLAASAPVTGQVLGPDGRPLPRASLRAGEAWVATDKQGRFNVDVMEGSVVDLRLTGYVGSAWRSIRGELLGVAAGSRDIVISAQTLPSDRTLNILVVTPDGKGVEGIRFNATPREGRDSESTGADGRLTFTGLPAMEVNVYLAQFGNDGAWARWAPPAIHQIKLVPEGQEVVFRFREANPIRGVLVGKIPRGKGATLNAQRGKGIFVATALAAEDGSFRINVPADETEPVQLIVYLGSRPVASVPNVKPGSTGLRIDLNP